MQASSEALDRIRDVFALLHDGVVASWVRQENGIRLQVDCRYIAERLTPSHESFFIELTGIGRLDFEPWLIPVPAQVVLLTDPEIIFRGDLEFLVAEHNADCVEVTCRVGDSSVGYSGGNLFVACQAIAVFDEEGRPVSLELLAETCRAYWEEWSRRSARS